MKTAILLYGSYTDWYKKNSYYGKKDTFLFGVTQDMNINMKDFAYAHIVSNVPSVPIMEQISALYGYYMDLLTMYMRSFERLNNISFDCIVYTTFGTLLTDDINKGIYKTSYYNFKTITFENPIGGIELVSDTCVRINGGVIQHIDLLMPDQRDQLFSILWKGKVKDAYNVCPATHQYTMFIPSVINTSLHPLDYTLHRSIFTSEERLRQTIDQLGDIESMRADVTNYVLEGTSLTLRQIDRLLKNRLNTLLILFTLDEKGNYYANKHPNKSTFEIYVLLFMLSFVKSMWYFKFGGRYTLTEGFRLESFLKDKPVCKVVPGSLAFGKDIINSVLYSFPHSYVETYKDNYRDMLERTLASNDSIESLLYEYNKDIIPIHNLGIYGRDAIEGFEKRE